MHDPATATYFGVPGYALLWALTILCVGAFANKISDYVGILLQARPEKRWDNVAGRARLFAANVLAQKRLLNERAIGVAHLFLFWSFIAYAVTFAWSLARGLFPFLPIPYPDEIRAVGLALQAFAAAGLLALVVAAVRRYFFTPPHLARSLDALNVVWLIAVVLLSSAWMIAVKDRNPSLVTALWWVHMATVLGFLAYIPYSKHLHLLAAPFGVFFGSERPVMPAPSEGASARNEFTWRQLFSGLACAECGRCDRACPAVASGASLSPKELMVSLKELMRARGNGSVPKLGIDEAEMWRCSTCAACMRVCPVFNEHVPVLIETRRHMLAAGKIGHELQAALSSLERYGNSFACSPKARARWTTQLDFKIKDARKEPVEYLWFTGDFSSYHPSAVAGTRATARLFHKAGLDFGILYDSERNSGADVRRIGEDGLFESLAEQNAAALSKVRFEHIVTTDPHTYHALKNEYPRIDGGHKVFHHTEVLEKVLNSDALHGRRVQLPAVTYQDPCYLGRYNGIYDAPRRALRHAGIDVIEMARNRENAFCCGAGGGRIWMEESESPNGRPSEIRVREAASLHGVQTLVTACPKDRVMFEDALKTTGLEARLKVRDIAEAIEDALA